MKKLLLTAALALSTFAFAQPPGAPDDSAREQRMAQFQQMHAQRMAEKLGLDANGAQRFQQTLESFNGRRQELHAQMKQQMQVLRAAAQGDATAQGQVDTAIGQLQSLRQQQAQLRLDQFNALAQGLTPQQKAKLIVMFGKGEHGHFGHDGRGHGRWGGPQGPQQGGPNDFQQ